MTWQTVEHNGMNYYQCPELNNSQVVQACSDRSFGNMALHTGDNQVEVVRRRELFLKGLGLTLDDLVAATQIHGTRIAVVNRSMAGYGARNPATALPDTDGLVTRERGLVLSIFTADCYPIFLYDRQTPAVGLVHAGWRGTINRIVERAVSTMTNQFGTDPRHLQVVFGPAICGECFRVHQEVASQFEQVYPETVHDDQLGYRVDLAEFNCRLLEDCGISRDRIINSNLCTVCTAGRFFSYRAEAGTTGRLMGIIALK